MFLEDITEAPLHGITLIYGPAGTGKTTLCLQALHGRALYISTNKNFNVDRLQAMRPDAADIIKQLILFEPTDLLQLEKAVDAAVKLSPMCTVLVVDSIATYLRSSERKLANLALHRMLATLKKSACPILLTSEVYEYMRDKELQFLGGDMLRINADTIVELHNNVLTLKKHREYTGRQRDYRIVAAGLQKI